MHRTRAELPNGVLKLCRMQLIDANVMRICIALLSRLPVTLGHHYGYERAAGPCTAISAGSESVAGFRGILPRESCDTIG